MAPRTPKRPRMSEPFVTLSISKSAASKLSESLLNGADTTTGSISVPSKKHKGAFAKRASRSTYGSTIPDDMPGELGTLSQNTSPISSLLENSLSSVNYDTPSTSQNTDHNSEITLIPRSDSKDGLQSKGLSKSELNLLDYWELVGEAKREPKIVVDEADTVRRSSTASLTDTGTRSSARARKLTTKAQALAGTNFLPSLQHTSDAESMVGTVDNEDANDQPAINDSIAAPDGPRHETPETKADETTVDSVETPVLRASTRERKPTTRAIDIETKRMIRKRPGSPLATDRSSKSIRNSSSKPSKPSKLSQSTLDANEESQTNIWLSNFLGPEASPPSKPKRAAKPRVEQEEEDLSWLEAFSPAKSSTPQAEASKVSTDGQSPKANKTTPSKLNKPFSESTERGLEEARAFCEAHHAPINEGLTSKTSRPAVSKIPSSESLEGAESVRSQTGKSPQQPCSAHTGVDQTPPVLGLALGSSSRTSKLGTSETSAGRQDKQQEQVEQRVSPSCDLSCLSRATRLFAFAKVASDWSDSEDESDDDIDIDLDAELAKTSTEDSTRLMQLVRDVHCRCRPGISHSEPKPSKKGSTSMPTKVHVLPADPVVTNKAVTSPVPTANIPSRRSTRDKPRKTYYEPAAPLIKRPKTKHEPLVSERQTDEFERHLQLDHPTSRGEQPNSGTDDLAPHPPRLAEKNGINGFPTAATFNLQPLRFQVTSDSPVADALRPNDKSWNFVASRPGSGVTTPDNQQSTQAAAAATLSNAAEALRLSATNINNIQNRPAAQTSSKPTFVKQPAGKASKVGIRGGAKMSAGGSVRLSLHDGAGHDKDQEVKRQSTLVPPQAKSIKLRFTTTSK